MWTLILILYAIGLFAYQFHGDRPDRWKRRKLAMIDVGHYLAADARGVREGVWFFLHRSSRKREEEESQLKMDEELRRIIDG